MKVQINENYRGLVLKNGKISSLLLPGKHFFLSLFDSYEVKMIPVGNGLFDGEYASVLLEKYPILVKNFFEKFELSDTQIGILSRNGKIFQILSPSRVFLFWKETGDFSLEIFDLSEGYEIPKEQIKVLKNLSSPEILHTHIHEYQKAALYVDGKVEKILEAGEYGFWNVYRDIKISYADMREQLAEISGQDILTKDKISVRVNISAYWKIDDVLKMIRAIKNGEEFLYKEIQFSVREVFSSLTIDELFSEKAIADTKIAELSQKRLQDIGISLLRVGIKDIILPGDMREIMNKVLNAEKSAQANVIKRREETASTRSLLNTAKLMEDNPVLLRLKELETLQEILQKVDTLNVSNGFDGLLENLVTLRKK